MKNSKISFLCPHCLKPLLILAPEEEKSLTEIQKLVNGWKLLNNIPVNDKTWDKVHYSRCAKSAKSLIDLFGFEEGVNCMEYVFNHFKEKNYSVSLEGIVKHSDKYREVMDQRKA